MNWFLPKAADAVTPEAATVDVQRPDWSTQVGFRSREPALLKGRDKTSPGERLQFSRSHELELQSELLEKVGGRKAFPGQENPWTGWQITTDQILARLPDLPELERGEILTRDQFDAEVLRRRLAEEAELKQVLRYSDSTSAAIVGGLLEGVTDPYNVMSVFLGGPVAGKGVVGFGRYVAGEAAINAGIELASIPREAEVAQEFGRPSPDPLERALVGGAFGAVLGAPAYGIARALDIRVEGRRLEGAARDPAVPPIEHEARIDAAEAALREGREPSVFPPPAQTPALALPPVTPDAPAGWARIRNGIFDGESHGDFDALFGFSNRPGGAWSNVRLTEMTVDQAIAFSDPSGPYAQWVKARVGRVATPMGAYQIVGTTLRSAKKGLGLRGDEVMSKELQERLGQWIYRQQGTGAWEGYRGPSDSFGAPPTSAPGFQPQALRRGMTSSGEVTSPVGTRVPVRYEVVDLSSLRQASGDLQPRDRAGRSTSDEQVAQIAAGLDPQRLMPSPEASHGTPIVGPDGIIESGNGRVLALGRAAELHPDRYQPYVEQIRAAGFDIPDGIERPVLIARRQGDMTPEARRAWVTENNAAATMRMSDAEQAATDADYLTAAFDAYRPGTPLHSADQDAFVSRFLGQMPQAERAALQSADGRITASALQRIRRALFARAFDAPDLMRLLTETDTPAAQSMLRMLEELAPDWAAFRAMVDAGYIKPEFDITDALTDVTRLVIKARGEDREGQSVIAAIRDRMAQGDLLQQRDDVLGEAILRAFYKDDRARGPAATGDILRRYTAEASQSGRADIDDLFDAGPSPAEVMLAAIRGHEGKTDYALPAAPEPVFVPELRTMDTAPVTDGTASPLVQRADDALQADLRLALEPEPARPAAPAGRELQDALDDARGAEPQTTPEMRVMDDTPILLTSDPKGQSISARDLLAELDGDADLIAAMQVCHLGGPGQ